MGRVKELLFDAADAERALWEASPEGRECSARVRQESARRAADEAAAAARQEKAWAAAWPREWQEWQRVRLLFNAPVEFGDSRFGFEEFLKEVGRAPSPRHAVRQKCEAEPYRPGNIGWVEEKPEPPASRYLNSRQAADYLGIAVQTLRNNRGRYRPVNATKPLMFDESELDAALRGLKRPGRK